MKILVQDRRTNEFLTHESRWVKQADHARAFANSLEALRFCLDHELTQTDLLVCYSGGRKNLRLPLC